MFLSNIRNSIKSRLGFKSILASILLISAISIILSTFFVSRQKTLLMNELHKRALSLVNNLTYNSQIPLMAQDEETLLNFISGVKQEGDIADAFIAGGGGIMVHSDTTMVGQEIQFPENIDFDTVLRGDWFPAGDGNTMRIVSLITGIPARASESSEFLLTSPVEEEDRDILYGSNWFPCFTADSKEITFSNNRGIEELSIWSINIETRAFSQFLKSACNGWWSQNGRYFVFLKINRINKKWAADTSIFDTETDEIRIIQKNLGSPQPHFSFDDKYIISTKDIENEESCIVRIPFEGGEPEQITFHEGQHVWPESSPDGKWIIYTEYNNKIIYAYNTETEESSRVFPDLQVSHQAGTFSPDGKKICYKQLDNDEEELFIADFPYRESSEDYGTQLTFTGKNKFLLPDWSPDGRWITYSEAESSFGERDIFIISPEGGEPINLTRNTPVLGFAVLDVSLKNMNRALAAVVWQAVVITLIMIGIGSLGVIYLVRSVTGPIHNLAEATGAVGRLDFDQSVPVNRTDEIGVLAGAFNHMIQQLKVSSEELDTLNRELEQKVQKRTAELEKSHSDLEKAYKELETLDMAKDDFLSLVSHELRTPLSSVLLYSEMLLDGLADNEETRNEFLTTIVDNCKRLTRLINDVLDLSKIEAGRMPFNIEDLNIRNLVEETHSGVRPSLESNGIHFDYENVDENIKLRGDRDKIIQVLTNIISNSVKFTPDGGKISVSTTINEKMCEIAVKDTGKGIKKEDIPKVFDRFSQIESIDHHSGGTGLGMTISKSIIERLGGKIRIESEINKGTTVFFTLPRAKGDSG